MPSVSNRFVKVGTVSSAARIPFPSATSVAATLSRSCPMVRIPNCQLHRRVDVATLLIAAHMQIMVIGPPIGQTMDEPWVGMKVEDDRLIRREQRVELPVGEAVRMFGARQQPEEIDDVDKTHFQ